jgi:capsular polysaccharide biosynthesis protein
MDAYCLEVRKLENKFYGLEFHHIVRDNNVAADVLSKLGSTRSQAAVMHDLCTTSTEKTTMIEAPGHASNPAKPM